MNEQVVLPMPGEMRVDVAAGHVHQVDLIERIARLALALKDELTAVLRPVAFAGPAAFDGEPADPGEEVALGGGACARREPRSRPARPTAADSRQTNAGAGRLTRQGHRSP